MWTALGLHLTLIGLITAAMFAGPGLAPQTDPEIEALYASGSWIDQVQFRLDNFLMFRIEPIVTFPLLVFLFLLGVTLFRAGAFGGDEAGQADPPQAPRVGPGDRPAAQPRGHGRTR